MADDIGRLRELLQDGRCCAVALAQLGLEMKGEKNERLLQAMSGLCGGVHDGLLCGALTGAACLMNILDPANANARLVQELARWFVDSMKEGYGGADCRDILRDHPPDRAARCRAIVEATYRKAREILEADGVVFD